MKNLNALVEKIWPLTAVLELAGALGYWQNNTILVLSSGLNLIDASRHRVRIKMKDSLFVSYHLFFTLLNAFILYKTLQ
jgi:hypothetical protein